jgi:hypothetical protein
LKREAIRKKIKDNYVQKRTDRFSAHISKTLAKLKRFPEMGIFMQEIYDLNCDYYMKIRMTGRIFETS